jgi:protein-disulfide isomerase
MRRLVMGLFIGAVAVTAQQELVEGRTDSKVRVVVYEDLQCSDCASFRRMMDQKLLPKYGAQVAFVHKDFPLPRHAWARKAAIAARFFESKKPELGLAYRKHVLATMFETTTENFETLLRDFAERHGIGPQEPIAALGDNGLAARVDKDFQDGVARGVSKTPTVFVNGRPYIERFTFEEISKGIDQALAEAQ